jgi:hypothetical protein
LHAALVCDVERKLAIAARAGRGRVSAGFDQFESVTPNRREPTADKSAGADDK